MEQIASQAAVSKRTLYKYYPVKDALLEGVLEDALAKDLAQHDFQLNHENGFRATVEPLLQASARWCEQHPDYLLPYVRYKFATFEAHTDAGDDRGLLPLWTKLITMAQSRGELRTNRSSEQLGVYFHYLYLGALMRWLTAFQLDLTNEFNTVMELFLEGASEPERLKD